MVRFLIAKRRTPVWAWLLATTLMAAGVLAPRTGDAAQIGSGDAARTSIAAQEPAQHWTASIAEIRRVAGLVPGRRPLRINMLKFAESHRAKDTSVLGAPAVPSVQSRTVFQVVYADGTIMIDSGMSETVHKELGRGAVEPYFPEAAAQVHAALRRARLIVVSHEHGDHIAGVVEPPLGPELAPKTVLTHTQLEGLMNHPQFPEIRVTPEAAARYITIDYDRYYPLAPGMALIKAPGHTPGSQMIYVRLDSGREYLFAGDSAWHMDNIRLLKPKNAPWVHEDQSEIMDQLVWLHGLLDTEKSLIIVVSHDDEEQKQLIARHLLGAKLE